MMNRPEREEDRTAVPALVEQAFGRPDKAHLVAQIRADKDAVISLVVLVGDLVVGHVMLSRMIAPFRALVPAPVAVVP